MLILLKLTRFHTKQRQLTASVKFQANPCKSVSIRGYFLSLQMLLLLTGLSQLPDSAAWSQPDARYELRNLEIKSAERIKASQLRSWLSLNSGDLISKQQVNQQSLSLLERLRDEGYYFAQIDSVNYVYSPDSAQVDVLLFLHRGDRLRIGQFEIHGLPEEVSVDDFRLKCKPGDVFYQADLESDIGVLISHFERIGYPYCRVEISDMRMQEITGEQASLSFDLMITPGPRVVVGEIVIRGNKQTQKQVIVRELPIREGDIYDQDKVDQIPEVLGKLGFFRWVENPVIELLADSTGRLTIELEEGNNNRFDGVIGYNPPANNESGFVTGFVDIAFRNLLGTGRQIEARWARKSRETQELAFRYFEPWMFGWPLHAGFGFQQLIQDTSYVERSLGIDMTLRLNDDLSVFTTATTSEVSPDSIGAILFGIQPSRSLRWSLGLSYITLDHLVNPTKGVKYRSSFEVGAKRIQPEGPDKPEQSFRQERLAVDLEAYISILRWQVFAAGLHGRTIGSEEEFIAIPDQYRLGGTRSLRGYREDQFRGSRVGWANFEYRYLLNSSSRLFAFVDVGYFFREELAGDQVAKIEDVKIGYGIGIRLDTKLGFLGLDYGIGEDDRVTNGKVHIGLTNTF